MNKNETKLSVSERRETTLTKNIPTSLTHNGLQQLFAMSKEPRGESGEFVVQTLRRERDEQSRRYARTLCAIHVYGKRTKRAARRERLIGLFLAISAETFLFHSDARAMKCRNLVRRALISALLCSISSIEVDQSFCHGCMTLEWMSA